MFVDVSDERRSVVWKHFLLDTKSNVAKCKLCEAKNVKKLLSCKNGSTNSLFYHIKHVHKYGGKKSKSDETVSNETLLVST